MADGHLIHWFRNDLRLHDLPSLSSAMKNCSTLYPIYIFDQTEIEKNNIAYNRVNFIIEALQDIDCKLKTFNGKLFVFYGKPVDVLSQLLDKWNITHLSYEEDIQPDWCEMEPKLQLLCEKKNVHIVKSVSHTLWDSKEILKANRGQPPVTYDIFCQVAESLGPPLKPEPSLKFLEITLSNEEIPDSKLPSSPEDLGVLRENDEQTNKIWTGGETWALKHLENRLEKERNAYDEDGIFFMPTQVDPDILGPPLSMSAALSVGCLSVRKFYWDLLELHKSFDSDYQFLDGYVGQLLWREYFYTMCSNNPNYGKMLENPICLSIAWDKNDFMLQSWTEGKTGFPFIDAAMRQMRQEGWMHHVARNAVACFLTRGDLWISWEEGFKIFMKYTIDADFAVCAGNWMWVSSSAFENILQCSSCLSPVLYGRRFDPSGDYIKKYVSELKEMPIKYVFEPWLAPLSAQEEAGCIIGKDYPFPIVDHDVVSIKNTSRMNSIKEQFLPKSVPAHCTPSNETETRVFMWLPEQCLLDNLNIRNHDQRN